MSKTFCILPWIHVATTPSGHLRVCCNSTHGENVPRRDGAPYRLAVPGDIERYWNDPFMKALRLDLLNGREPSVCKRCFTEERAGVKSGRQSWNEAYGTLTMAAVEATAADGTAPVNPVYLDIRLGNLCNLRCRMCNPYSSSMWVEEWNGLYAGALSEAEKTRLTGMEWFQRPDLWEGLKAHLGDIDQIYLTGGEPTLATGQYALLDEIVDRGLADRITLKYNTNATNIPKRLLGYWDRFRSVRLNLSVDATGALDRYIRYPSNWAAIDRNLRILDGIAEGKPDWVLTVHTTVQMYNATRLHDLFGYTAGFRRIRRFPFLNILNHPDWLNIRVLPTDMKTRVSEELMEWYDRNATDYGSETGTLGKLPQTISYMNTEDWSHLLPTFFEKTAIMDASRSERLLDVLPEFGPFAPGEGT